MYIVADVCAVSKATSNHFEAFAYRIIVLGR